MEAGRELDALVAENVMGLMLTCPVDPRFDHSVGTNRDGTSAKRNFCRWPDGKEHWIPFYSTDIAAAWLVVVKLVSGGKVFIVKGDGLRTGDYPLKWTVLCDNQPRTDADTAPLAVCLAALKAVGYHVDRKEPNP